VLLWQKFLRDWAVKRGEEQASEQDCAEESGSQPFRETRNATVHKQIIVPKARGIIGEFYYSRSCCNYAAKTDRSNLLLSREEVLNAFRLQGDLFRSAFPLKITNNLTLIYLWHCGSIVGNAKIIGLSLHHCDVAKLIGP
jgi:hypothetical protein